jgi:hypothetical protein
LFRLPTIQMRFPAAGSGIGSAFVTGLLLALVFGRDPAARGPPPDVEFEDAAYGGALLFVYGIGIAIPVVVLGASAARLAARSRRTARACGRSRHRGAALRDGPVRGVVRVTPRSGATQGRPHPGDPDIA